MSQLDRLAKSILNIHDLRDQARRALPRGLFDFLERGAEDEISLHANRASLDALKFRPRIGIGVGDRKIDTLVFGKRLTAPIIVGPTGMAAMLWPDGEYALAQAAAASGVPFTIGTHSLTAVERFKDIAGLNLWLQAYVLLDRGLLFAFMERAYLAGARTMVVTLDANLSPNREYNTRSEFTFPIRPSLGLAAQAVAHPRWTMRVAGRWLRAPPYFANLSVKKGTSLFSMASVMNCRVDPDASWESVEAMRREWPGDIVIKGVLRGDDARRALDVGAAGVVVSNHGGRSLDGAVAAIDVLGEVVDAVGQKMTVLFDSGIRRGADIAKAMALGAHAVMIGRATLYGIASYGRAGGEHALRLLMSEFDRVVGLLGCQSPSELHPELLMSSRRGRA